MINRKQLNTNTSNYIFIGLSLLFIVPISLFLAPMFISVIIAPFQPEFVDVSKSIGMLLVGLTIMLIPIHLITIICRMPPIYICETGFHFYNMTIRWKEVEKITLFLGNSARFTIKYNIDNKHKKVFGSLFLFNRGAIIDTLESTAKEHNILISRWWL